MTRQEIIKELLRQNKAWRKYFECDKINHITFNCVSIAFNLIGKIFIDDFSISIYAKDGKLLSSVICCDITSIGEFDDFKINKINNGYTVNDFLKELI